MSRTTYIVGFEINNNERRKKFKSFMRNEFSGVCPIQANLWAIRSKLKASEVRDQLVKELESQDKIFVVRSGVAAAWRNTYGQENTDWLKKYL